MGRLAFVAVLLATIVFTAALSSVRAQDSETISFQSRQLGRPVQLTATVYWPPVVNGPVPALVVHHGSAGLDDGLRTFAKNRSWLGVAAILIDSFKGRGLTSVAEDQSRIAWKDYNYDSLALLMALGKDSRFNSKRIGITGFSKGGVSTLMAAHERFLAEAGVPANLRYAFHVPYYPGCSVQPYMPKTSGAPIMFLLGAADNWTSPEACETYAAALKREGANVEVHVFPDAGHGFDAAKSFSNPNWQNDSKCVYQEQADGNWLDRTSRIVVAGPGLKWLPDGERKAAALCRTRGASVIANTEARDKASALLRGYINNYLLK